MGLKKVFLWYLDVKLAVLHYKNNDSIKAERFKFAFFKDVNPWFLTKISNYLILYFLRK